MTSAKSAQRGPAKPRGVEEVRLTYPHTPERKVLAPVALPQRGVTPDAAYRVLLGHTTTCAACRAGFPCSTAVGLGRAWREVRRG